MPWNTASGLKTLLDFFSFLQKTEFQNYFNVIFSGFFSMNMSSIGIAKTPPSDGDFCRSKPFEITPSSFGDGFLRRNSWAWSVFFSFSPPTLSSQMSNEKTLLFRVYRGWNATQYFEIIQGWNVVCSKMKHGHPPAPFSRGAQKKIRDGKVCPYQPLGSWGEITPITVGWFHPNYLCSFSTICRGYGFFTPCKTSELALAAPGEEGHP